MLAKTHLCNEILFRYVS